MANKQKERQNLKSDPYKNTQIKLKAFRPLQTMFGHLCPIVFPSPPTEPMFSRGPHNNCSFGCPPVGRALQKKHPKDIAALRSRLIASSSDLLEINWIA